MRGPTFIHLSEMMKKITQAFELITEDRKAIKELQRRVEALEKEKK